MRRIAFASVLVSLVTPVPMLHAQLRASELASVSQTVDGTTFTVNYSRPRARGRTGLFGTRIHRGEVWTPGANHATTLAVSKDITIEGTAVPKGAYSVWIDTSPGKWELILDRDTSLFHTQRPRKRDDQIRFAVHAQKHAFMEVLTWWFPDVTATGATLAMQWDTVYVPLRLGVASTFSTKIAPAVSKRLVGTYEVRSEGRPGGDTKASTLLPSFNMTLTIRQDGDALRAVMEPPMSGDPAYRDWNLLRSTGGWFYLGRVSNGEIIEIEDSFQLEFDKSGDRASKFEIRMLNDDLVGKGTRSK